MGTRNWSIFCPKLQSWVVVLNLGILGWVEYAKLGQRRLIVHFLVTQSLQSMVPKTPRAIPDGFLTSYTLESLSRGVFQSVPEVEGEPIAWNDQIDSGKSPRPTLESIYNQPTDLRLGRKLGSHQARERPGQLPKSKKCPATRRTSRHNSMRGGKGNISRASRVPNGVSGFPFPDGPLVDRP